MGQKWYDKISNPGKMKTLFEHPELKDKTEV